MNRRLSVLTIIVSVLALLAGAGTAHAATYAQIQGTGSTWSKNIVDQWIADVSANGMQVVYTGGGSSRGRSDFAKGAVDYAITEIPYQGKDEVTGQATDVSERDYAYLPIVAGGTAFTYQLKVGTKMVRNLRLSGETLAKIFTNKITNWNDPAIKKDNNGAVFPDLPITPVVRSDGSGTTAQLTTWMDSQYPTIWRPYFGKSGLTSYYPRKGRMVGAAGSDQVMNQIASASGNGTIGYIEYSYPLNKTAADDKPFPVVKVLNKGGYFVEPTQYNVAVALTKARVRGIDDSTPATSQQYLTQDLTGVYTASDPRAYPLSSYSYAIIPTGATDPTMSTAKRQTLADFLFYGLCEGQTKAGPYGYSPLPLNLVDAGLKQIERLKAADKAVQLEGRDVTKCNNPTFDGKDRSKNVLASKAPMPAACDKVGAGPCGTDTGTNTPSTDGNAAAGTGTGGAGTGGGGGTTAPGGTAAAGDGATAVTGTTGATTIDPETGAVVSGGAAASGATATAVSTELVSTRSGDRLPFAAAAVAELLLLVTAPGFYLAWLRRRKGGAL